ncbi:hypothetical protein QUF54_01505, partial [Candidatus Marithioploca araucensis]|nr:hypothetical protein [Candidatus Marithioploca araucensis]
MIHHLAFISHLVWDFIKSSFLKSWILHLTVLLWQQNEFHTNKGKILSAGAVGIALLSSIYPILH